MRSVELGVHRQPELPVAFLITIFALVFTVKGLRGSNVQVYYPILLVSLVVHVSISWPSLLRIGMLLR
jgi:hypothetical protein